MKLTSCLFFIHLVDLKFPSIYFHFSIILHAFERNILIISLSVGFNPTQIIHSSYTLCNNLKSCMFGVG
jgi:hypothetical protein